MTVLLKLSILASLVKVTITRNRKMISAKLLELGPRLCDENVCVSSLHEDIGRMLRQFRYRSL